MIYKTLQLCMTDVFYFMNFLLVSHPLGNQHILYCLFLLGHLNVLSFLYKKLISGFLQSVLFLYGIVLLYGILFVCTILFMYSILFLYSPQNLHVLSRLHVLDLLNNGCTSAQHGNANEQVDQQVC